MPDRHVGGDHPHEQRSGCWRSDHLQGLDCGHRPEGPLERKTRAEVMWVCMVNPEPGGGERKKEVVRKVVLR